MFTATPVDIIPVVLAVRFSRAAVAVTVVVFKLFKFRIVDALPFTVYAVGMTVPNVLVKFTGMPLGIWPWDDVSPPWLLCVKSEVMLVFPPELVDDTFTSRISHDVIFIFKIKK
jgi:hypothetical protein